MQRIKAIRTRKTRRGQRGKCIAIEISAAQLDTIIQATGIDQVEKDLIEIKLGKRTQKVWDFPMMMSRLWPSGSSQLKKTTR